jgi:hypothetical protein
MDTNSDDVDYSDNHREFIEASKNDETTTIIIFTSNVFTESIITTKTKSTTTQYRAHEDTSKESTSSGYYEHTTEFLHPEDSMGNNKIVYINKTDDSDNNNDYLEFTNTPFPESIYFSTTGTINSTDFNIETTTTRKETDNENGDITEAGSGSGHYETTSTTHLLTSITYTEPTHLLPDDFDPQYEIINAGSGNVDETY